MNRRVLAVSGRHGEYVNVSAGERMLSALAGGTMAALALRQKNGWVAAALATGGGVLAWRAFTGFCPAYRAAGVNSAEPDYMSQRTERVITINKPPAELYASWRNLGNLPRVMTQDAEITADVPDQRIAWRSLPGAAFSNAGSVEFRPATGGRGTVVRVAMEYQPPAGGIGLGIAKLMGRSPGQEIEEDLRRFKQIVETGEASTVEGQPSGPRRSLMPWHLIDRFGRSGSETEGESSASPAVHTA